MKKKLLALFMVLATLFIFSIPAVSAPQKTNGYTEVEDTYGAYAIAVVTPLGGNQNGLTITVAKNGFIEAEEYFTIPNNSSGEFTVGEYRVYVSTSGNNKIDYCFITYVSEKAAAGIKLPDHYVVFDNEGATGLLFGKNQVETEFEDEALKITVTGGDPYFIVAMVGAMGLDADEYRYAKISLKNESVNGTHCGFFFGTDVNPGPAGPDNTLFLISTEDTEYNSYVVDMIDQCAEPGRWTGNVTAFRIDPIDASPAEPGDVIYIKYIAFFKTAEEAEAFDGNFTQEKERAAQNVVKDGNDYASVLTYQNSAASGGQKVNVDMSYNEITAGDEVVGYFTFDKNAENLIVTITKPAIVDLEWSCANKYASTTLEGVGIYALPRLMQDNGKTQNFNQITIVNAQLIPKAPEKTQVWLQTLHPWLRYHRLVGGQYVLPANPTAAEQAAYDDYFEFLTDPTNWKYVSENIDTISLFGYITSHWTNQQVDAFCDMIKATGIKVAFEMGGMGDYNAARGNAPGSEAEARFWFEQEGLNQTAILRMIARGVYVDYLNFDGTISRIMGTQNDPRKATTLAPDMTLEEACAQVVWLIKCYQEILPDVQVNYLWNFPNHSWKSDQEGGYPRAYTNGWYNNSNAAMRQGYGDAYKDLVALDNAVKNAGWDVPLVGFTLDTPYNYRDQADGAMYARMLDFEQEAKSRGYKLAIVFNTEVGSGFADKSGQFYKGSLQFIDEFEKLGGSPDVYIVESWYPDYPAKTLPETEPYTLTYLAAEVLRHVKEGKVIDVSELDFRVPAMTWKWPGSGSLSGSSTTNGTGSGGSNWNTFNANSGVTAPPNSTSAIYEIMCTDSNAYIGISNLGSIQTHSYSLIMRAYLSTMAPTADTLHIKIKNATEHTNGKFFFMKSNVWYDIEYAMLPASEQSGWQDITIDLTLNSNWSGTVTQIRLQPAIDAAEGDYFELELIEFIRHNMILAEEITVAAP